MSGKTTIKQLVVLAAVACMACPAVGAAAEPSAGLSVQVSSESELSTPGAGVAVAWSMDGSRLAAASQYGNVLTIWDRTGRLVNRIIRDGGGPTLGGSLAFAQGSSQIVFPPPGAADNDAAFSVWETVSGRIVKTVDGPQPGHDYPFNRADHFATSPDETMLAIATRAGPSWGARFHQNIAIYDTRTWKLLRSIAVPLVLSSLCVFGNGRFLGLGTVNSGQIVVVDPISGATVTDVRAYEDSKYGFVSLGAIAGSPAGDLILSGVGSRALNGGEYLNTPEQRAWDSSMSSTEAVRLFRVKDGARVATFPFAHGPIRQAMWDPKGRYVAFVDDNRGLFLWAPWRRDGYRKVELQGETLALAVSPDGDQIAVTANRGVRVFSLVVAD